MVKLSVSCVLTLLASAASLVYGAALTKVNNFGTNPTGAEMYIYVPDKVAANPAVVVAIHYCTGTAASMFAGTQYKTYADQYGFIVVYPDAPDAGGCWDVHTPATLTHNGGGDSLGIVSMVKYTISTYKADASRVFAVGISSGAMMTQVLMGAYPDVFAAGSSWSGVPFGCFAGSNMWNSQCAQGQITKTGVQWGDQVRAAYPGYTGKRPKIQLAHGTEDDTLYFANFGEAIKQWTNVFGVSETPTLTTSNSPVSGWTRTDYGANVEAIRAQGQPHNVPHQEVDVLKWFGINSSSVTTPTTPTATKISSTTKPPTTSSTPPPSTGGGTVAKWGQCGGIGWSGGE